MSTVIERSDLARDALYNKVNVMVDERLSKDTISNCILEIPQRINAKIDNNVLTLKSGSSMWYPNGDTYSEVSNSNDLTLDLPTTAGRFVVCMSFAGSSLFVRNILNCVSGSGVTTTGGFAFDTDAKTIINYSGSGSAGGRYCAPFCLIDVDENGNASFAKDSYGNDMIFNGAGFIGHHAFVYPNVSGLRAIGFNEDKTLKSQLQTTTALQLYELPNNRPETYLYVDNGNFIVMGSTVINGYPRYVKEENWCYCNNSNVNSFLPLLSFATDSNNIVTAVTKFDMRQPVRLATTEMLDKVQDQVDTKQDTLVSGANIKTINGTTVLGSGNFALADQSLSNLNSTGQMVVDSQNGTISNCILEIPQNIKVTLENNVIILKSGSVLTHTGETYQTTTTTADTTWNNFNLLADGRYMIFTGTTGNFGTPRLLSNITSGSSLPESATANSMFFNTTDKKIYRHDTGSWAVWNVAYPLAIVDIVSGVASFAKYSNGNDMIFNGMGFIGHHIFTYPQPKYLSGNGKNDDGTLASYDNTLNSLTISEMSTTTHTGYDNVIVVRGNNNTVAGSSFWRTVKSYDELLPQSARLQFVEDDNIAYAYTSGGYQAQSRIYLCTYEYDGTTVTKFDIRQPYEGARNLLTDDIEKEVATKANDSEVAKIASDNTFTGKNTFLQNPVVEGTNQFYEIKDDNLTKGTAPTSTDRDSFIQVTDVSEQPLAACFYRVDTSGNAYTALVAYKYENNNNNNAQIGVFYNADGTSYGYCPPPIEDTLNSTQIDTVGARNTKLASYALDANVVHKTGNENIAGEKTLTDKLTVDDNIVLINNQNTYRHLYTDNSAITKGTAPSANTGTDILLRDSNNVNIGSIATWYNTSGTICTALRAYNPTAGTTDSAVVQVNYTADGKAYATCPTPAISDDSNKIVTTKWFNDKLVLVNELPANPDSNVWYAIPESNS